jgi:hypothetical protein
MSRSLRTADAREGQRASVLAYANPHPGSAPRRFSPTWISQRSFVDICPIRK